LRVRGRLLGLERHPLRHRPRATYGRLVVVEWQGRLFSFPVSEVSGIRRHHLEELKDPPPPSGGNSVTFTRKILQWHSRMVGCLDEDLLFSTLNRNLA